MTCVRMCAHAAVSMRLAKEWQGGGADVPAVRNAERSGWPSEPARQLEIVKALMDMEQGWYSELFHYIYNLCFLCRCVMVRCNPRSA